VGFDRDAGAVARVVSVGAEGADSLASLAGKLSKPRAIWIMVPSGAPVDETIAALIPHLSKDDILIDGGNSNYKDTQRRGVAVKAQGFQFVDVGTSGGVWGLKEGYSMMVGGDKAVVEHLRPLLETLAPAKDKGWGRVGPSGAGHFVKMVHNGIEYGLMAAYAEGLNIIKHANVGLKTQAADAETTPLRHPERYKYDIDIGQVAEVWRRGSVVASWLLDLAASALRKSPDLANFEGRVSDSGEGRWTLQAAIDESVPAPVISAALFARFSSRGEADYADRLLSALRFEFGGHVEKPKDEH
jgi:6-phosphogluconate dehydrogenase